MPEDTIKFFDENFKINSNQQIELFIKKYIGFEKYSYHQIHIFIKLITSQFTRFKSKLLNYIEDNKEEGFYIGEFSKYEIYYVMKGYTKYLIEKFNNSEKVKDNENHYFDIYEKEELKREKFDMPLLFSTFEKLLNEEVNKFQNDSGKYNYSKFYLKKMKEIFEIENEIEEEKENKKSLLSILQNRTHNYIITNENFKKMVLYQ